MMENVPEIMAWLAIIEARIATTNIGQYSCSVKVSVKVTATALIMNNS